MTNARGRFRLDAFRHLALDEVGSTNSECLARARAGDPGLLWVTASRQTQGRGRRGRAWTSEPGNLYASLLLIDAAPADRLSSLPLAVAVAVHETVKAVVAPGSGLVQVKWPNDILIDRRKTCGILMEGEALPGGRHALVIGIGINILHMPQTTAYAVTRLSDHGASASAEEVFARLFSSMAEVLEQWDEGRGTAAIVERWRAVACGLGEPITVNLPDRVLNGSFTGIDERGFLLLDQGNNHVTPIAAGDVFFARTE